MSLDKTQLSERDICTKFILPALEQAGWDRQSQLYEEYPLRVGRVIVRGNKGKRDPGTVRRDLSAKLAAALTESALQ